MTDTRYTGIAISLHWLMAAVIITLFALGIYMHELPLSPEKLKLYSWHKWAGVCVFLLAALRLGWRLGHRTPSLPSSMSRLEQIIAHAGHHMLYLLMFAIPFSGWMMSSAKGFQTVWFEIIPLPDLLEKNKALGELLQTVHWGLNMLLAALVVGHVGAALKHHFIVKDNVLTRMLPAFKYANTLEKQS
jgi:cytochrome b561